MPRQRFCSPCNTLTWTGRGDDEATNKAEHCEGPDVQAAVAVVHGVQTKHRRDQSADHRQGEEVANLSQATVNGHPVVAGQIAPKFLIEDRVTASNLHGYQTFLVKVPFECCSY